MQCGDVKLYVELRIPDVVPAPAVLICHGLNAMGLHGLRIYVRLAEEVCKAGFVSLVFDFRLVGLPCRRLWVN
jgi:alpha-beta hydrolase superfamily lysophospholipase